jgi:hypothetical protein
VLFAGGVWLLQTWLRPALAAALVGAYVALASGYAMTIARDFERVWETQRTFWHEVVACCSDLQEGTVLIHEWDGNVSGQFIFDNSWADPLVLERTFSFPREWSTPPRLFSLTSWHERVESTPGGLEWRVPEAVWYEYRAPLPQSNVILLRREAGRVVRVTGSIEVGGGTLTLKPPGGSVSFPPGPLWRYFAAPDG